MPRKLCLDSGCAAPPTYRGYCQLHARCKERRTNRAGKKVYNLKRWRILCRRVLFEQPLCECGEIAVDVHHRVALADGGDPWARDNVVGLCKSCHGKVTRAEQDGRQVVRPHKLADMYAADVRRRIVPDN